MTRREFITLLGGAAADVAVHGACAAGDAGDCCPWERVPGPLCTLPLR